MSQLTLFEYEPLNPDYWLEDDNPDSPLEHFMCWKRLAGVALTKEFVVCLIPELGYEFRTIALQV